MRVRLNMFFVIPASIISFLISGFKGGQWWGGAIFASLFLLSALFVYESDRGYKLGYMAGGVVWRNWGFRWFFRRNEERTMLFRDIAFVKYVNLNGGGGSSCDFDLLEIHSLVGNNKVIVDPLSFSEPGLEEFIQVVCRNTTDCGERIMVTAH